MICASIQNQNGSEIREILSRVEMAEIRLDRCDLTPEEIDDVFSGDTPTVATCRIGGEITVAIAQKRLTLAVKAGATYVDVEIEAPKPMANSIRSVAREYGTRFIRSYHDFEGTPSLEALKEMVGKCRYHGAETVKIVTTAHSAEDAARVLSLYEEAVWNGEEHPAPIELIAFAMGQEGSDSRLECLKKGAPYTYAALSEEEATAPGQWRYSDMCAALYDRAAAARTNRPEGGFLPQDEGRTRVQSISPAIPCSISFAQRAIVAAALSEGVSTLEGYTPCSDNEAALKAAAALGARIERKAACDETTEESTGETLVIEGIGATKGGLSLQHLHTGESGLLTRLMIPLCAQLSTETVRIEGEKTLLKRPLSGAKDLMDAFGATCGEQVPLEVKGPLGAGRVDVSGRHGSQLISGLLMALPLGEKNTTLSVSEPKSIPYLYITLDVLRHFGITIGNEMLGGKEFAESGGDWDLCSGILFKIKGGGRYRACNMTLEGDWSAAANFLVAGAIFGAGAGKALGNAAPLSLKGLDTSSLQADLGIMDVLMDCGACLSQLDGAQGEIIVQRAPLHPFVLDATHCPDLFPILAVLAAFCGGQSRIGGVGRLAHKESNRAVAITEMLTKMGVPVHTEGDEMVIEGMTLSQRLLSGKLLHGGAYTSCDDHRMVMALRVASLGADSPILIDNEACVEKSFPGFNESFKQYEYIR